MEEKQIPEINEALRAARAEWEKEAQAREREIRAEAEREAGMTAKERMEHEHKKRRAELDGREQRLLRRELRADAGEELRRRELPAALADALDYADADRMHESLDRVERAFREAVQTGLADHLRGEVPKGHPEAEAELTDAEYYRRYYNDRNR